jgi:5-methylcytosine-specific restriction endonuclease McrA
MAQPRPYHTKMNEFLKRIPVPPPAVKKYKKQKIPIAIREAVWVLRCGRVFEHKCLTSWCPNTITVFDFQSGHNVPESKGGKTIVDNLYPLCSRCNTSMGDRYTFDQWTAMVPEAEPKKTWSRFFCLFKAQTPPSPARPASSSTPSIR